jgi:uncharacterized protein YeaO (DUF488 family)
MQSNPAIQEALKSIPKKHITLVYGARDPEINHAVVLAGYLKRHGK